MSSLEKPAGLPSLIVGRTERTTRALQARFLELVEKVRQTRPAGDIEVLRRSFDQRQQFFDLLLRSYGGSVQPLDNMGHYRELSKCWSPGQAKVWDPKSEEIDWFRTVTDLCQFSELAPRREPEQGFFLDGHYFGVMIFKAMPRSTWPKTSRGRCRPSAYASWKSSPANPSLVLKYPTKSAKS